jgi:flagellar biosynthetic protein FliO
MKMYVLTLALITALTTGGVLAQATEEAVPPPVGTKLSSPARAQMKEAKPVTERKKTPLPTSSPAAEVKTETVAPPLSSLPVAEAKSPGTPLPFQLNEQATSEAPSISGLLARTFGALLLIIGLIAAAGWGLRYFGIVNFGKPAADTAGLKVLNTVSLGDRRSLNVVKFGERTLLIGSTTQGLTLLAEQNDEPEALGAYMPTVRTVTDLLDVEPMPRFDEELTRASLLDNVWQDRSVQ